MLYSSRYFSLPATPPRAIAIVAPAPRGRRPRLVLASPPPRVHSGQRVRRVAAFSRSSLRARAFCRDGDPCPQFSASAALRSLRTGCRPEEEQVGSWRRRRSRLRDSHSGRARAQQVPANRSARALQLHFLSNCQKSGIACCPGFSAFVTSLPSGLPSREAHPPSSRRRGAEVCGRDPNPVQRSHTRELHHWGGRRRRRSGGWGEGRTESYHFGLRRGGG